MLLFVSSLTGTYMPGALHNLRLSLSNNKWALKPSIIYSGNKEKHSDMITDMVRFSAMERCQDREICTINLRY